MYARDQGRVYVCVFRNEYGAVRQGESYQQQVSSGECEQFYYTDSMTRGMTSNKQ